MADTTDIAAGDAPDVVRARADGSLPDLGGRRAWVWMRGSGGCFDVRADRVGLWLRKGASVVPGYPINFGPAARRPAPAGADSGRRPDAAAGAEQTDQAAGEPAAADTTTTRKGGRTR